MIGRKATLSGSYQFSSPTISARAWKLEPIGRSAESVAFECMLAGGPHTIAIVAISARALKPVEPCDRETDRAMRGGRSRQTKCAAQDRYALCRRPAAKSPPMTNPSIPVNRMSVCGILRR